MLSPQVPSITHFEKAKAANLIAGDPFCIFNLWILFRSRIPSADCILFSFCAHRSFRDRNDNSSCSWSVPLRPWGFVLVVVNSSNSAQKTSLPPWPCICWVSVFHGEFTFKCERVTQKTNTYDIGIANWRNILLTGRFAQY